MVAIDYDDYLIAKHCPFFENDRKYVFWCIFNEWQSKIYFVLSKNFRKVTTGFVEAVRWLPLDRLKKIDISKFPKNCGKVNAWLKTYNDYINTNVLLAKYVSELFLQKETSQNKFVKKFKKHIFFFNKSFWKSNFYEITLKNMLESDTVYMII